MVVGKSVTSEYVSARIVVTNQRAWNVQPDPA